VHVSSAGASKSISLSFFHYNFTSMCFYIYLNDAAPDVDLQLDQVSTTFKKSSALRAQRHPHRRTRKSTKSNHLTSGAGDGVIVFRTPFAHDFLLLSSGARAEQKTKTHIYIVVVGALPGLFASSQKLPLISAGSNPLSEANCTRAQQKLGKDARARGPTFFLLKPLITI
jgi:hypothetical protein